MHKLAQNSLRGTVFPLTNSHANVRSTKPSDSATNKKSVKPKPKNIMNKEKRRKEPILISNYTEWSAKPAKVGLKSKEVMDLLDIEAYFRLLGTQKPKGQQIVLDILEDQSLIQGLIGSGWTITNSAAILLAKKLKTFSFTLARKGARFIVYKGINKLNTKYEAINKLGYASGFDDFVGLIQKHIPQSEEVKEAVRELVANALIHQDFLVTGNQVMVEMYTDRIEISYPGLPLKEGIRNQQIADLMKRFNICTGNDSSIEGITQAIKEKDLPTPEFRIGVTRTTAILEFRTKKC